MHNIEGNSFILHWRFYFREVLCCVYFFWENG